MFFAQNKPVTPVFVEATLIKTAKKIRYLIYRLFQLDEVTKLEAKRKVTRDKDNGNFYQRT